MLSVDKETARLAVRKVHTLCLERSGNNDAGDVPLSVSMSTLRYDSNRDSKQGRIVTRYLRILPDAARMLNRESVSDDLYEQIRGNDAALTEGEGAEKLFALLQEQCVGPQTEHQHQVLRYSLRGESDMRLIRSYLWREGYKWPPNDAIRNAIKVVDLRHALMILAGICRVTGAWKALPKELRDYDLDFREFTAEELCRICGVSIPKESSQASALLRLVFSLHATAHAQPSEAEESPERERLLFLKKLGAILECVESLAGVKPLNPSAVERNTRLQLLPVVGNVPPSPAQVGLLLVEGAWLPVVRRPGDGRRESQCQHLIALPDGRPLDLEVNTSMPLAPLELLKSESGWDEDADKRLQRICEVDGKTFGFQSLLEAAQRLAGAWPSRQSTLIQLPSEKSNPWFEPCQHAVNTESCVAAGKAAYAINRNDAAAYRKALDELGRQGTAGRENNRRATAMLVNNLQLVASRAGLLKDERKAWLRQMAFLADSKAWAGEKAIEAEALMTSLLGNGPVAMHNRTAVASRSAWGIPASPEALTAVTQAPIGLKKAASI